MALMGGRRQISIGGTVMDKEYRMGTIGDVRPVAVNLAWTIGAVEFVPFRGLNQEWGRGFERKST
jgi:hypothetical protein